MGYCSPFIYFYTRNLFKKMTSVKLLEYTAKMEENINRRVVFPWNKTEYLPVKKHLRPLADGIRDNRLGMLYFVEANHKIATTLVNYAAHPLTCQSDGSSSLKISSDYPGVLRNIVEKDLGGFCIFTQGACGDLHPKYYEHGFEKTEEMGKKLAAEVISSFSEPRRFEEKYLVNNPVIETRIIKLELEASKIADSWHGAFKKGKTKVIIAEVQILRIGDICFVGVPGEILVEPALEIVWNSPFKKTYILYNSTAYLSYLNHANAFYSGGYEPGSSNVSQFATFDMIAAIVHEFKKMKV